MARSARTLLFAAIGFAGLLVLVAGGLLLFVHAKVGKARLEAAASGALGMEVSVGGRLGMGFFHGVLVTLEDVHIRNLGRDLASAKQARIEIGLLPLLKGAVQIEKMALQHATIFIEKDRDGRFNFEQPEAAAATLPALDWPNLSLSHGTLVYADQRSAGGFEAADCRLEMHRLRLSGGQRSNFIKDLSFTAELACGEVRSEGFTVSDLKLSAVAKNGVFDLSPVTTRIATRCRTRVLPIAAGTWHADVTDERVRTRARQQSNGLCVAHGPGIRTACVSSVRYRTDCAAWCV